MSTSKFILVIFFITLCGCASVSLSPQKKIIGTWGFQEKSLGPLVIRFKPDYTFEVDANADGKKDIWGRYKLRNDRIQFIDDEPRVATDCYEPGFHYFEIERGVLRFQEFAEQCRPRKYILKQPMIRRDTP